MPDRIIFTGTSSGLPSKDRVSSSFILQVYDTLYQFDAGEGFTSSALRNNIDIESISSIFITHTHSDHLIGLFMELQYLHLQNWEMPLEVYLPDEAIDSFRSFLDTIYLFPEKLPFNLIIEPVREGDFYNDGKIAVKAYPSKHLVHKAAFSEEYDKPNKCQAYCYEIIVKGKRVFYTGDIKSIDDIKDHIAGVDILIAEGMHVDTSELIAICRDSIVGRLIITHLPDEIFDRRDEIMAESKSLGYDNVDIACDDLVIEL